MNVAVVGAGLAGLTAACELADLGHRVTVFEKRPWAGGKTYSFRDRESGAAVDNGQHVFMACTTAYEGFLRRLGTLHLTRRQRRLRVQVFGADGRESTLQAQALPSPLHLGLSFLRYRHLGWRDKAAVGRAFLTIRRMSESQRLAASGTAFGDWLAAHGQSPAAIRDFWDFLLIPTLNCRSGEARASDALFVIREGFLASSRSSAVGVSAVGLSDLHVAPAVRYIEARGGSVRLSSAVSCLDHDGGRVTEVALASGERVPVDAAIIALPHRQVAAIVPEPWRSQPPFDSLATIPVAPIVNLHFWFDRPVAGWPFAAFVGNELQWVFNHDRLDRTPERGLHHLAVSLSAAQPYMALNRTELRDRFLPQVRQAIPGAKDAVLLRFSAIKEPEATFVPAPGICRPGPATPIPNVVLAGAYTNTGWPATMESAVRSGLSAARELHVKSAAFERSATSGSLER
jgi:hydroxysqualene dehydroxylase